MSKLWQKIKSVAKPIEILLYVLFVVMGILLGVAWAFWHISYLPDFIGNNHSFGWETLATGILALIAAIFTVGVMLWQTEQNKKEAELNRWHKADAAKAVLAMSLLQIRDYAEKRIRFLCSCYDLCSKDKDNYIENIRSMYADLCKDTLNYDTIENVEDCIACCDDCLSRKLKYFIKCYALLDTSLSNYYKYFIGFFEFSACSDPITPLVYASNLYAVSDYLLFFIDDHSDNPQDIDSSNIYSALKMSMCPHGLCRLVSERWKKVIGNQEKMP